MSAPSSAYRPNHLASRSASKRRFSSALSADGLETLLVGGLAATLAYAVGTLLKEVV